MPGLIPAPGWTATTLGGHPVDLFEPARRNEHGYVVVYLHGVHLKRLAENATFTREFERHGLPAVAPATQRSWWSNKVCAEFDPALTAERHLLANVMPWIAEQYGARAPRIALLGTSMGGQGGLRFAFKHPNLFPIVAALAPAIDYQQRFYDEDEETLQGMYADAEAARQDTATLHVHPLNWPRNVWFCSDPADDRWHDSAQKLRMKLASLGIPHDHDLETSAGGHSWDYYNHMAPRAIEFLVQRLEKERLRAV
jgi:S-formylglutathione hydrolase FrmB